MPCQHPGKILLQQYMEPEKVSQNHLARAIKVPPRRINEIVHGKRSITADTAVRLAVYFGGNATYWLQLQAEYEIEKVETTVKAQLSSIQVSPRTPAAPIVDNKNTKTTSKIKRRIMR